MLYIVGTPIGNIKDISIRQLNAFSNSDIILAEDTRSAKRLINLLKERNSLKTKKNLFFVSYFKEKELEKIPQILKYLKEDKTISLISESGMPLISDPGYMLVKLCIRNNIPFEVVPGPSAVLTAVVYSGFNPKHFTYFGYFPKKESEIKKIVNKLVNIKKEFPDMLFVFYESAKRINKTLNILNLINYNFDVSICSEMTKKHENIKRGKISKLLNEEYKGEITIVLK